jgi:hypothetical protein
MRSACAHDDSSRGRGAGMCCDPLMGDGQQGCDVGDVVVWWRHSRCPRERLGPLLELEIIRLN